MMLFILIVVFKSINLIYSNFNHEKLAILLIVLQTVVSLMLSKKNVVLSKESKVLYFIFN